MNLLNEIVEIQNRINNLPPQYRTLFGANGTNGNNSVTKKRRGGWKRGPMPESTKRKIRAAIKKTLKEKAKNG